jgi:alkanesulfonate monooxygenase SsuD/methylene tetrahydromethanopterin reductase-like flavin-dependent oxidoreductase (luciferase family)
MHFGVYLPTFGEFADASVLAEFAAEAEAASWDGVFIWDHLAMWWDRSVPAVDSWVALSAIAVTTSRVRIGALVTPIPRRRPWKLARETVSVDRLSGGRLVVGVGLGANENEFDAFGEARTLATRAAMLDEGLEVLTRLWTGDPFSFAGDHYAVADAQFYPRPRQTPRIPIWVAGSWPKRAPFRRASRWDGAICALAEPGPYDTPVGVVAAIRDFVTSERTSGDPFDLVLVTGIPDGTRLTSSARSSSISRSDSLGGWKMSVRGASVATRVPPGPSKPCGIGFELVHQSAESANGRPQAHPTRPSLHL